MSLLDSGFSTVLSVSHRVPLDLGPNNRAQNRDVLAQLINLLSRSSAPDACVINANTASCAAHAGATFVMATASGSLTLTLNGVAINRTWATSDAATGTALANDVRVSTDPLIQNLLGASNVEARVTLATMTAGSVVRIGIPSDGTYNFVATAAATGRLGEFSIAGTDTQDAAALAAAINAYPVLNQKVRAEAVAGVCHLYAIDNVATGKVITAVGGGITVTAGTFAASGRVHVFSILPAALGNSVTIAGTGTGVTVANTAARLVGGVGGNSAVTKLVNGQGAP